MATAKYASSQTSFYAMAHVGADRLTDNLGDFTKVDPDYTLVFAQGIKARIDAADALPDHDARKLIAEALWTEVDKLRKESAYQFGIFLSTIDRICDASLRDATYDAAGRKYYMAAKNGDVAQIIPMYSSLNPFISDNWDALSTVGKMTPAMRDDFIAKQATYKARYDAMTAAERVVTEKKDEKINANNACYDEMNAYLKLAQRIYADDPVMAKSFTFAALRSEVETVGNAGLSGKITNILNKDALKGATITIKDYNKVAVTEKSGRFDITPLSMGKYTVIVECPGYETQTFKEVKIRTGVTTRLNVKMVPIASA
jgi:Carboxypeptidase regulatory-like domain